MENPSSGGKFREARLRTNRWRLEHIPGEHTPFLANFSQRRLELCPTDLFSEQARLLFWRASVRLQRSKPTPAIHVQQQSSSPSPEERRQPFRAPCKNSGSPFGPRARVAAALFAKAKSSPVPSRACVIAACPKPVNRTLLHLFLVSPDEVSLGYYLSDYGCVYVFGFSEQVRILRSRLKVQNLRDNKFRKFANSGLDLVIIRVPLLQPT
ncbi:NAD(P)H-quinone oxidoreductase subunit H [Striga asiatica]|uniref:NAD(P)H-quinone oxidoreductase subunit H n=1 Tax=Striga asiatica TaxID=4170 RepID=A0A5A7PBQ3_STRAF|nr:NAD(P)H-quinone oxidoreductase subunit H [Striga asiatica]